MSVLLESLAASIRERRAILFAGAGLSMIVGLPSWRDLIDHMGKELGVDDEEFFSRGTNYQILAEYYRLKQGSIGPLRSWMDRNWRVAEDKIRKSRVHELIIGLDFPLIYTTNYDRNLEKAYDIWKKPYVKIVNARDVAKIREGVPQIVKFHGDFDDDNSLVIAETDYFNRLSFDSPLDIKFRADALGKTILFIGYSMSDTNIRLLLHRLWQTWEQSGYGKDRPQSFVFMVHRNPVQETVLARWGINVLTEDAEAPEQALSIFLAKLKKLVDGEE